MSTNKPDEPLFEDPHAALREIAQNPAAYAHYLADFHRVLLDMAVNLEILQRETRLHCRKTRVEGDKWGQAMMRSLPVERSLTSILKDLKSISSGLEKSAHKRHAHDEKVKKVANERRERAKLKASKSNPSIQAAQENPRREDVQGQNAGYDGPASIYDLGRRESA
ncbi:hypothetical protein ACIPPR_33980 [Streptomyces nigra]|uniref:hypothetical protein n=1 Tax=Streptomyces nigra TaxID=1827580 RepID=UPI00380E1D0D